MKDHTMLDELRSEQSICDIRVMLAVNITFNNIVDAHYYANLL